MEVQHRDQEKILYADLAGRAASTTAGLFLGGNVRKVTSISYQHSLLKALKASAEWKAATAGKTIEFGGITRTYVFNSDVSLVTIPIRTGGAGKDYFNVYIQDKQLLITKLSETRNSNGLTTYSIRSSAGELYYQFDLNGKNQMGNWKFDKDIPKAFTARQTAQSGREGEVCSKKKFYGCMNCLIIDVCGSDWLCTIACGLAVPSCVGGAALVCLLS
jgi:hypothetical protein